MKKLTHNRSTVANINYHIVWSKKRCKRVPVPELAADMQVWFREAAHRHSFTIHMLEIGHRDHVHVLLSAPASVPVSKVLQYLKGYTAKKAFEKYAFLLRAYPSRHLWNPSSFVETIGCISEDVMRRYIHNQDYNAYTERR